MSELQTKHLPNIARVVLGAVFVVFGINGFLQFMPSPPMTPEAGAFMGALVATGYMFPLIKLVEIGSGILLLANRCVPLALVLLAPGIVNIFLFHVFLAPGTLPLAVVVMGLEIYLAYTYRDVYRPMLSWKATPTARKAPSDRYVYDRQHGHPAR